MEKKIFGLLNHEVLKKMSDADMRDFVINNARYLFIEKDMIKADDTSTYHVDVDYKAVDGYYNDRGHLLATMTCKRKASGLAASISALTFVPDK